MFRHWGANLPSTKHLLQIERENEMWTAELEFELCGAIADVLHRYGLHDYNKAEHQGWTPEQVAQVMALLQKQVAAFENDSTH